MFNWVKDLTVRKSRMNLILSGIFIHLILIAAIFDTYFKSPIVKGMASYKSNKVPPAKRLVLFVADGLRAESLYGNNSALLNMDNAPFLNSKITSLAASWGVSHTRVPTESRPGHVALAAGIYEDPSAIAKGWKENPVEFDSIFNQSSITWAWGSPDIIPLFSKTPNVHGFSYSSEEEDFSGKLSTTLLDTWVFDRVERFFLDVEKNSEQYYQIKSDKIIFFLHLLGLDTAGHTFKPYSKEHRENIRVVDEGIKQIEKIIDFFYKDKNTTYIFTADHGMTDWGSHGAGSPSETETPFIAWGAGILPNEKMIEIQQADLTPLMSTLIGIPFPVNSIGVLPFKVLNMSDEFIAHALFANAKQIFAQFDEKRRRTEENSLAMFYKPYPELSKQQFKNVISTIEYSLKDRDYSYVIQSSQSLIQASLLGLNYYQNYYQRLLLSCSVLTYIGWIALLLIYLTEPIKDTQIFSSKAVSYQFNKYRTQAEYYVILHLSFFLFIIGTWLILYVQSLPLMYYIYCTLPLYIWWTVFEKSEDWIPKVQDAFRSSQKIFKILGILIMFLIGIEMLVICFFYRETVGLTMILLSFWPYSYSRVKIILKILWTVTCIILAIFPFLPVVGSEFNLYLIAITAVVWIMANFGSLFLPFSFVSSGYNYHIDKNQICLTTLQSLLLAFSVYNLYAVDISIRDKNGLLWHNQYASWILSGFSILVIFFSPDFVLGRLFHVTMAFLVPFILLSVSYEPLFLLTLFLNLLLWLAIEVAEYSPMHRNLILLPFNTKLQRRNMVGIQRTKIYLDDFRRAFFIILYVVLAFFGMGNMASVNSFDPMWVRNFVTIFSPFTMTSLILFKILIPYLIVSCVFRAVTNCVQAPVKKLFFIVLIFCDLMGLHFLFLVKNHGSWLEIGSSISHYIIVQAMVLFLLLLYILSKMFTDYKLLRQKNAIPIYRYKVHRR